MRKLPPALCHLNQLADAAKAAKHPNFPDNARVKSRYSDDSANALTTAILACIELHGGYAVRINTQGQYNEKLGRRTFSTTRKGTADIHGCLSGRHLSIEVKFQGDTLSEEQKSTASDVERAGGLYFVARDYEAFWHWFQTQFPTLRPHPIPRLATPDLPRTPHRQYPATLFDSVGDGA